MITSMFHQPHILSIRSNVSDFPNNGMLGFTIISDFSKEVQDDHWDGKFRIHIFRFSRYQ